MNRRTRFVCAGVVLGLFVNGAGAATTNRLNLAASPPGSGLLTAQVTGSLAATGAAGADFWSFDALAGDRLTVWAETGPAIYPQLAVVNSAGAEVHWVWGNYSNVGFQDFAIQGAGTYYLRLRSDHGASGYRLRGDLTRGRQLESEGNNTQSSADTLAFTFDSGSLRAGIAGALDSDGDDLFAVGYLNRGDTLTVNFRTPAGSVLNALNTRVGIQAEGASQDAATNTAALLTFDPPSDGFYFIHVGWTNTSIGAQYLLDVTVQDSTAPTVTSLSLPSEGGTESGVVDRIEVRFSEQMDPAAAGEAANYSMRSAGADDSFGTADDLVYAMRATYERLTATCRVTDGPLQPGIRYRFSVGPGVTDRLGHALAAATVRTFSVAGLPPFVNEGPNNGTVVGATPLGTALAGTPDGSFARLGNSLAGPGPRGMAAGDFTGDGVADLAVALSSSDAVAILEGRGNGTFAKPVEDRYRETETNSTFAVEGTAQSWQADDNSWPMALPFAFPFFGRAYTNGHVSSNGRIAFGGPSSDTSVQLPSFLGICVLSLDLRTDTAGYDIFVAPAADRVTIRWGARYYSGGAPVNCSATLFSNGVIRLKYGAGNANGGMVGVSSGDGINYAASRRSQAGTMENAPDLIFTPIPPTRPARSFAVGDNPFGIAAADFNGDGRLDLAVANDDGHTVSVLRGNGDGTFGLSTNVSAGNGPRSISIADFNRDGRSDFAVACFDNGRVSVFLGDGAGGFALSHTTLLSAGLESIRSGLLNGDAVPDLVVVNRNQDQVSVLIGAGDGTFGGGVVVRGGGRLVRRGGGRRERRRPARPGDGRSGRGQGQRAAG